MPQTRRDRLRAATVREITQTARHLLVEYGPPAVTLRAIAREMGMTAPALYRYFDSHEELLGRLVGDLFSDLVDELNHAVRGVPPSDLSGRFLVAARGFRRWALAHEREYALLFGTPLPGLDVDHDDFAAMSSRRLGWTFLTLFLDLWQQNPFPIDADEDLDPVLRAQLKRYRKCLGISLPLGALLVFLQCWVRLQGSVSLEVFGHLRFAFDEPEPLFELMLAEVGPRLGLTYSPPQS
jgi:AcrR family transcriptional regulator